VLSISFQFLFFLILFLFLLFSVLLFYFVSIFYIVFSFSVCVLSDPFSLSLLLGISSLFFVFSSHPSAPLACPLAASSVLLFINTVVTTLSCMIIMISISSKCVIGSA